MKRKIKFHLTIGSFWERSNRIPEHTRNEIIEFEMDGVTFDDALKALDTVMKSEGKDQYHITGIRID